MSIHLLEFAKMQARVKRDAAKRTFCGNPHHVAYGNAYALEKEADAWDAEVARIEAERDHLSEDSDF